MSNFLLVYEVEWPMKEAAESQLKILYLGFITGHSIIEAHREEQRY